MTSVEDTFNGIKTEKDKCLWLLNKALEMRLESNDRSTALKAIKVTHSFEYLR